MSRYDGTYILDKGCNNIGLSSDACRAVNKYFEDGFVSKEEEVELEKFGITGISGFKPLQHFIEQPVTKPKVIFSVLTELNFLEDCLEGIGKSSEPVDEEFIKLVVERYMALLDFAPKCEGWPSSDYVIRIIIEGMKNRYRNVISSFGKAGKYAIPSLVQLANSQDYFRDDAWEALMKVMPSALPEYAAQLLQGHKPKGQATILWAFGALKCTDLEKIPYEIVKNLADNSTSEKTKETAKHVLGLSYFCENNKAEETLPSQRPVACLKGDTPFKITTDCTEKNLLKAYKMDLQNYSRKCKGDYYYRQKEECDEMRRSLPSWLRMLGTLDATHPFFNIYLYMTPDSGFDNIRSARTFEDVASSKQVRKLVAEKRSLTILYPGSGAHISPIVIPLKLIDEGQIDSAKLIFTEAYENDLVRLKLYLNWYNEHGTITGLKTEETKFDKGSDTLFKFYYRDKPISLLFTLNRTDNNFYANEDHIRESDMVVIHDDLYEFVDNQVSNFLLKLKSLGDKPRIVISEDWWELKDKNGLLKLGDVRLPYTSYEGPYGCYGRQLFAKVGVAPYRLVNGMLVKDTRPAENQDIPTPTVRMTDIHVHIPPEALLIEVF